MAKKDDSATVPANAAEAENTPAPPADEAPPDAKETTSVTFVDGADPKAENYKPLKEISFVDNDGRTKKVKFSNGKYTTDDPFIAQRLAALADNPDHPLERKEA